MKVFKKYLSVGMLLMLLLSPLVIQLMHSLDSDHIESEICTSEDDNHLHEHELDCEICKFQFNSFIAHDILIVPFIETLDIDQLESQYSSLQQFSKLNFSLRAPPVLV
ncbi:hypothetical protein [Tenacibaculum jejuense]|uniref:DUF2946 domain-containing protein n=1 Tax=Tenacibaculum jejuense TaxID=584609 RepID=A0A238UAK2_9FLAO|nr:hypothetical protein [Tenacibaculum jejuense]SNR16105.1 Probable transmembrane protein of unknown function [Tenacibaculum jejuense]